MKKSQKQMIRDMSKVITDDIIKMIEDLEKIQKAADKAERKARNKKRAKYSKKREKAERKQDRQYAQYLADLADDEYEDRITSEALREVSEIDALMKISAEVAEMEDRIYNDPRYAKYTSVPLEEV